MSELHTVAVENANDMSIDELEAMISGLSAENDETMPDEVTEENDGLIAEAEIVEAISDVTTDESRKEAYEEQEVEEFEEANNKDAIDSAKANIDVPSESKPKVKKEAKPKVKRVPRKTTMNSKASEVVADRASADFFLLENADLALDAAAQKVKHAEVSEMIDNMNVKVKQKSTNLLSAMNGNTKLSVYAEIAMKFIFAQETFKVAELRDHFMDQRANGVKSYAKGTASSQANNYSKVFELLKVVTTEGTSRTLNKDSVIATKLKVILT